MHCVGQLISLLNFIENSQRSCLESERVVDIFERRQPAVESLDEVQVLVDVADNVFRRNLVLLYFKLDFGDFRLNLGERLDVDLLELLFAQNFLNMFDVRVSEGNVGNGMGSPDSILR